MLHSKSREPRTAEGREGSGEGMATEKAFSDLVGRTFVAIRGDVGDESMTFECEDGARFELFHEQDCCEAVWLHEIVGDLADLLGSPVLAAEEVSSEGFPDPPNAESFTWTFYRLQTIKGGVTLRWLGESNGYYSESVSFIQVQS